jgi:hypothetical protein
MDLSLFGRGVSYDPIAIRDRLRSNARNLLTDCVF